MKDEALLCASCDDRARCVLSSLCGLSLLKFEHSLSHERSSSRLCACYAPAAAARRAVSSAVQAVCRLATSSATTQDE